VTAERKLGVIIQNDLKYSSLYNAIQYSIKFKTANGVIGMIERTFGTRGDFIIIQLCTLHVLSMYSLHVLSM
jgi:hypothetical protein